MLTKDRKTFIFFTRHYPENDKNKGETYQYQNVGKKKHSLHIRHKIQDVPF